MSDIDAVPSEAFEDWASQEGINNFHFNHCWEAWQAALASVGATMQSGLDACEVCNGTKGGVPGNENLIGGKVVCDYCHADGSYKGVEPMPIVEGWRLVPIEPTEDMVVSGFESWPDRHFSKPEDWLAFEAMSGCQQAAHKARLCWAAMVEAAPTGDKHD